MTASLFRALSVCPRGVCRALALEYLEDPGADYDASYLDLTSMAANCGHFGILVLGLQDHHAGARNGTRAHGGGAGLGSAMRTSALMKTGDEHDEARARAVHAHQADVAEKNGRADAAHQLEEKVAAREKAAADGSGR